MNECFGARQIQVIFFFLSFECVCMWLCVWLCVCADLRDIANTNSAPTIDFPYEVQSRETGFSPDYTFRRRPELGSRAGSEKFTSPRSRNRRCDFAFAFDVRLPIPGMIESSGVNWKCRAGVDIWSLRRWEEQLPRQMLVHLLRHNREKFIAEPNASLSAQCGLFAVESVLVLDMR